MRRINHNNKEFNKKYKWKIRNWSTRIITSKEEVIPEPFKVKITLEIYIEFDTKFE